ncbi:MAG: methyltransferase domain-containing protein [Bacteroidaceae bacterium]|nr:methyltransferase domain-containing protein [Bacteroidaceae bacterium]
MPGPDSFYTPPPLADDLLSRVVGEPLTAIDFCVGDGGLLTAVKHRFPNIVCYGVDISEDVIADLQKRQPAWNLACCDFKEKKALADITFLQEQTFDLIVLNPPFTCRGSSIFKVFIGEDEYHVSTAMSFLIGALPYLSDTGAIYAILPITCAYSQKDRQCWQYLQENYHACVLAEIYKANFQGRCAPNIALVYLGQKPYPVNIVQKETNEAQLGFTLRGIFRGRLGVKEMKSIEVGEDKLLFIHTTNLRNGKLVNVECTRRGVKESVKGYGVLIPRVCNPNVQKVVVKDKVECILSDCVILLQTRTKKEAMSLKRYLINNWTEFKKNYVGTGARYVTIERLRTYFHMEK